jgi:uncharacterized linocin/CFP29 family protein
MNHLLRELAPLTDAAWQAVDDEARARLTALLAARRLVDFSGPHGWQVSSIDLGRTVDIDDPDMGLSARQRVVQTFVEVRAPFSVSRRELDDIARGATKPDLEGITHAAMRLATVENRAVFHGWAQAGITGITEASSHEPIALSPNPMDYPAAAARAVNALRIAGIEGPYGVAVGPEGYAQIVETTEGGGYPLVRHLQEILGGPVVWAPGVNGAVVVSQRGGDFRFESGQDLSVGYFGFDADDVQLYIEETLTFQVVEPDAAVALIAPT